MHGLKDRTGFSRSSEFGDAFGLPEAERRELTAMAATRIAEDFR